MKANVTTIKAGADTNPITAEVGSLVSKLMQICGIAMLTAETTQAGARKAIACKYTRFDVDIPKGAEALRDEAARMLADLISLFGITKVSVSLGDPEKGDDGAEDRNKLVALWDYVTAMNPTTTWTKSPTTNDPEKVEDTTI